MKTITAHEIKRRGISAVDEELKNGPVHVIKNNKPQYVVMDEESYSELIAEQEASYTARLKQSLEEISKGNVQSFDSTEDLLKAIDSAEE
ncbi:MAG: type II toxin-antitoxin system Phd/YefM family antitoxin [Candidatus Marinimicrobia bacterium]|nr:type II toxin-antitoxin system Phd/YefM family antitoxin [Candidatus Neomarinimicrobiota bacterium]